MELVRSVETLHFMARAGHGFPIGLQFLDLKLKYSKDIKYIVYGQVVPIS